MNEIFKDLYEYARSITPQIDTSSPGLIYISWYTAEDLVEELNQRYSETANCLTYTSLKELAKSRILFNLFMSEFSDIVYDYDDFRDNINFVLEETDKNISFLRQEGWYIQRYDIKEFVVGDNYKTLENDWGVTEDKFLYSHDSMIFGHRMEQIAVDASPQVLQGVRANYKAIDRKFRDREDTWE